MDTPEIKDMEEFAETLRREAYSLIKVYCYDLHFAANTKKIIPGVDLCKNHIDNIQEKVAFLANAISGEPDIGQDTTNKIIDCLQMLDDMRQLVNLIEIKRSTEEINAAYKKINNKRLVFDYK